MDRKNVFEKKIIKYRQSFACGALELARKLYIRNNISNSKRKDVEGGF